MTNLIIFILIIQVIHFLGTWKLYVKAGRKAWEAAIPVYNAYVMTKIINRPWWWVILLFIPIVQLMMFPAFWVETVRSFKKEDTKYVVLAVVTLGFYIYYLNYIEDVEYQSERQLEPKTKSGEWVTSIVFALIAATIVHNYFLRPYTIPTGSLEKTLLIGDYLFVSKYHYGARIPKTPLALPMVHDTMRYPTKFRSYVKEVQLPYMRLPGLQKIKRNEIVVFNWPTDTVYQFRDPKHRHVTKPLDKKSNYVKRCVGIPGDSLEIRDGYVFIDGKQTVLPERADLQFTYTINTDGKKVNLNRFVKKFYMPDIAAQMRDGNYILNLTEDAAAYLKKVKGVKSVIQNVDTLGRYNHRVFPHDRQYAWTKDNYGPIYIPKKGDVVALNSKTISLYKRIIEKYENNNLTIDGDKIIIDGKEVDSYTIQQDYYWMMGDNRHNSEDARYWGFVPFDHVVGKPLFIWFSQEQSNKSFFKRKVRWDRMFTSVHAKGKPTSYLWYVVGGIALLMGISFFRKKKA